MRRQIKVRDITSGRTMSIGQYLSSQEVPDIKKDIRNLIRVLHGLLDECDDRKKLEDVFVLMVGATMDTTRPIPVKMPDDPGKA